MLSYRFFFNSAATTKIYTLSLHDALPISTPMTRNAEPSIITSFPTGEPCGKRTGAAFSQGSPVGKEDRKSTRLNSSHTVISYAVFCLKKKKENNIKTNQKRSTNNSIRNRL